MQGSSGGFASTIASRRERRLAREASPPATAHTHGTASWMSSLFEPAGRLPWCRRMLSFTQRTWSSHASSSADVDMVPLAAVPSGSSSSQCVSTACTTASGAPACR